MPKTTTKPRMFSLTVQDRKRLAEIRKRYGLPSDAAAMRRALEIAADLSPIVTRHKI